MQLSTTGRYGLRVMLDLALHAEKGAISRQEIANRQEVTPEYIAQIMRRLSGAGLVATTMGPGGGYRLKRQAKLIRLGDIFRATEGEVAVVTCVKNGGEATCSRSASCAARLLWKRLSQVIEGFLDSLTLDDLSAIARQLETPPAQGCQGAVDTLQNSLNQLMTIPGNCASEESKPVQLNYST